MLNLLGGKVLAWVEEKRTKMEKRNNFSTIIAKQATAILGLDKHSSYQALQALQGPSPNTCQMDNLKNGAPNFETD